MRGAIDALSESENAALGALSGVLSRLRPLTEFDGSLREAIALLESGEAQAREAAYALRHYADRIELDPGRLREVERRLEAVHNAARKFRAAPEALPDLLASLRVRLKDLEITADLEALATQEQAARSRYDSLAAQLSAERGKAATKLVREVNAAMKELAMAGGRFEVELRSLLPDGGGGQRAGRISGDDQPGSRAAPSRQGGFRRRTIPYQLGDPSDHEPGGSGAYLDLR